jgi:RNA polymerase sigma-70 factor (ECF subfamily)
MLGSMADAEDAVHDTFVKWLTIDTSKVENAKAYLTKALTNKCLNIIKYRGQKDIYNIDDLQDSLEDKKTEEEINQFDFEHQLDEAWKFLYKKLEPIEQAIFILREMFNVEYEDLQLIFNKKAENCRQIVSRAKSKLKDSNLRDVNISFPQLHLLESIKNASQKGSLSQLINDFISEIGNMDSKWKINQTFLSQK